MSKFSSKGKGNYSNVPKTLVPGNRVCKINSIFLEKDRFSDKDGVFLILNLESQKLENFEGFWIDPKDQSMGRHEGQVGRVKSGMFSFRDADYKGKVTPRDQQIESFIMKLANEAGVRTQLDEMSADTIEEYVEGASKILSSGSFLKFAIGGKEYVDKGGYDKHDLFLIKSNKGKTSVESLSIPEGDSKMIIFDKSETSHFRPKKKAKSVDEFNVVEHADLSLTPNTDELAID